MWSIFRLFVYVAAGRIWAAYPVTQIVMLIVACVTSGFVAPGVHARSGRPFALTQEFGSGTAPVDRGTSAAGVVGVGEVDFSEGSKSARGAAPPQPAVTATAIVILAARRRASHPFKTAPFPPQDYG